jgi:bifunctional ADP-heptose synthase (sugar kinase/adenylyltransferase)
MIIENYDSIINILKENQYSHIIFSDYNKWFINKDLITIVKKYQLWSKIYVDTKKHNIDIFWTNITLKINFDEFKKIIWWDLKDNKENILFHLKDISKKSKSDIVVTRSEKGFISYSFNKEKHLTQWSIFDKIIDVSWAWDTFLSWLVYWDIEWNDFLESSQIANKLSWNIIWKLWTSII